jgi:hypothetical protein
MSIELIGHVGVDSGQLLLCDPCYIDSQWEKEDFEDVRIYEHKVTKEKLQYMKDFSSYMEVIPKYVKNMNELIGTGEWEEVAYSEEPTHPFSYNACAKATLSKEGHGELRFKMGHVGAGVAFSTAFGDGMYPVFANYMPDGTLRSVEVVFQDEDDEENDFKTFNEASYGQD